jgi:hypothetical protein
MNLKKLLLASVALVALSPGAWAEDATSLVVPSAKEYTIEEAVNEGSSFVFSLVDDDGKVLYAPSGSNQYSLIDKGSLPIGHNSVGFNFDKTSDSQYTIKCYNEELSGQLNNWYFQSQESTGTVIFGWYDFTKSHEYGTDGDNLGLWEFKSVDGGGYKLYNVGTTLYLKDGVPAKYSAEDAAVWHIYRAIDILASSYSTTLETKAKALEANALSTFYTKINTVNANIATGTTYIEYQKSANAALAEATKTQTGTNTDWTGVLSNPDFKTSDLSAWNTNNLSSPGLDEQYHNCEFFNVSFNLSQTISGMKKGTYEISLQAFQRLGDASTDLMTAYKNNSWTSKAQLYTTAQTSEVNNIFKHARTTGVYTSETSTYYPYDSQVTYDGTTYYIPNSRAGARKWFDLTDDDSTPLYQMTAKAIVTEDDGDLTFGFKGDVTNNGWLIFDNFSLKYINEDVLVDASESEKLLEQELPSTPYNKDIKASIEDYTAKLKADLTNGTYYNALRLAIADAESSATAYISAKEKLDLIAKAMETTNVYTAKAKEEYYTTPLAKYNNSTLTTEEAEAIPSRNDFLLSAWDNVNNTYVINTWSTEGNNDGSNFLTPFFQYWTNDDQSLGEHTFIATIDNLTANQLYEVSAWSRTRVKDNATAAPYGVSLQVGDGTAINVCDASQIGTSQLYLQDTKAVGYADADGKLTIKYIVASDNNVSWLAFKNVNYTEAKLASEDDIASVKAEAEKQSAYVIGFEKGEYAIYNNYSYIQPLEEANAILSYPTITESMYNDAKSKLESNNWTVNEEEVNAVYDGTFAKAENNGAPAGWTMSNNTLGGDKHSRAFNPDDNGYLSGLNDTKSGLFIRFDNCNASSGSLYYYGQVDGYTIPLKANTTYKLKVDAVAWNGGTGTLRLNLYGPDGFTTLEQDIALTTDNDVVKGNGNPTQYNMIFNTGNATGNYTLRFWAPGDSNSPLAAITNVELYTYKPETRETEVGKFGTICLPYAFTPNGATLYSVDEIGKNVVKLTEATEVTGGIAYIYQADDAKQTFEYKDNVVSAPTAGTLTGYFVKHAATAGTYVLQTQNEEQAFYQVEEGSEPTIGAYRAYLTVPTTDASASAALRISFDNETTGIEAVKALTNGKAEIYDLNGRKLNKLRKGINIVDGVKVIVK